MKKFWCVEGSKEEGVWVPLVCNEHGAVMMYDTPVDAEYKKKEILGWSLLERHFGKSERENEHVLLRVACYERNENWPFVERPL